MPPHYEDNDDPFASPLPRVSQVDFLQSPWSASSQGSAEHLNISLTLPSITPGDLAEQPSLYERLDAPSSYQPAPRLPSPPARSHSFNIFPAQARTLHAQRPQPIEPPHDVGPDLFSYGPRSPRPESLDPFDSPLLAALRSPISHTPGSSFFDLTEDDIVDLTEESTPITTAEASQNTNIEMPARTKNVKRPPPSTNNRKRLRTSPSRASSSPPEKKAKVEDAHAETAGVEEHAKEQEEKAAKQAELVKQQEKEEREKPVKLAAFQCIICMDNPTDLTVTHCGHLFCSFCLHEALHVGGGKKTCPVCRQEVSVKPDPTNPGASLKKGYFPLRLQLMTSNKKGKQPAR